MKGDFTRLTFRPQKHYTSVRMQQGRLQLDADWNEQIDIQTHLRNAQSTDMIGFESGVPSVETVSGKLNREGFKISVTSDGDDLAIAPGHLYINGTLCELESGTFLTVDATTNEIEVETLTLNERPLEVGQWLEVYADKDGKPIEKTQPVKIISIVADQRKLTLDEAIKTPGRIRRLVTYFHQPDLIISPNQTSLNDGVYAAFIDTWERHITSVEDPEIREVALSIPDTATRTQTVWQLKLARFDELTKVDSQTFPTSLDDPQWQTLIQDHWFSYLQARRERSLQAKLNACAKNCPNSDSSALPTRVQNGSVANINERRLDNQLYRVEIHTPGPVGVATFKWSRDNGSIVSPIDRRKGIQGDVIPIQKTGLEAWTSAKPGQWIEITSTNQDLLGQPGALAPFRQATDTRILFDAANVVGDFKLADANLVRRWDHATPTPSIPTSKEWIPLENGIKVRFESETAVYETGDYWLIPSRAIDNDIQWPNNGAQPNAQPFAQSPQGIHHEYCLLALVTVKDGKFAIPKSEEDLTTLRDCRVVFPPLLRCVDKDQGIFTGTLEVQSDFLVTGKGRAGIGAKPTARLHVQGSPFTPGIGQISLNNTTATLSHADDIQKINIGDSIVVNGQRTAVTGVNRDAKQFTISSALTPANQANQAFTYQPAIARFDDSNQNTVLAIAATGNIGIGTITPTQTLDVTGAVKATEFLGNGSKLDGVVKTTGANTITGSLTVTQNVKIDGSLTLQNNSLSGAVLTDGSITETKLSADIITNPKLRNGSVTTEKLRDDAVTAEKLANNAVTNSKLANGAVGTAKLKDGAVTLEKLAASVRPIPSPWVVDNDNNLSYSQGDVGIGTAAVKRSFSVSNNVTIGEFHTNRPAPQNGLLVEGHVGIGRVDLPLTAKLQIQGGSNGSNAFALNVTNSNNKSLLQVRNDGVVTIGNGDIPPPDDVSLFVVGKLGSETFSGKEFTQISSRQLKQNIAELSSQEVNQLLAAMNPVKFNYITDTSEVVHAGFIAEDVPDLVASDDHQAIQLGDIVAILTKAVKDQRQAIASLTRIAKEQQAAIATLTEQLHQLQNK